MSKLITFFHHLAQGIANLWSKEPQVEKAVSEVITGVNDIYNKLGSPEVDVILAAFPNGVASKSVEELKQLLPEIGEVSHIVQDALTASDGVTDPTQKANAVITTTLNEVAKLPEAAKESQMLLIISSLVSKVLGISYTEASHLVSAKQLELQHAASA